VIQSEQAFREALPRVDRFELRGRELVLSGPPDIELHFAWLPPISRAELIDTTWTLEAEIGEDGFIRTPEGDSPTLLFRSDGTFSAASGCRSITGEWSVEGAFIRTPSGRARDTCLPAEGDRLPGFTGQAKLDGDRLTISFLRGGGSAVYRATDR